MNKQLIKPNKITLTRSYAVLPGESFEKTQERTRKLNRKRDVQKFLTLKKENWNSGLDESYAEYLSNNIPECIHILWDVYEACDKSDVISADCLSLLFLFNLKDENMLEVDACLELLDNLATDDDEDGAWKKALREIKEIEKKWK